jgi:hypothetical protein
VEVGGGENKLSEMITALKNYLAISQANIKIFDFIRILKIQA